MTTYTRAPPSTPAAITPPAVRMSGTRIIIAAAMTIANSTPRNPE